MRIVADMLFTEAQERAITDRDGTVLVSAAAGSGKTRVLVERLMRRVLDPKNPCNLDDFLIITFTKKAASELRARIAKELSRRLAEDPENRHLSRQLTRLSLARITTIDGFCSELIRQNAFALDLSPDFRQIEADETEKLRSEVAAALLDQCYQERDPEFCHLADTLGAGATDRELESALQQVYNSAQCHLWPDAWIEKCIRTLDLSQYEDAGQTPWGERLISEFGRFCLGKSRMLESAWKRSEAEELVQARYGPILQAEISQLQALSELRSWEGLNLAKPVFSKLPGFKQAEKTELQEQISRLRNDCKKALNERLQDFSSSSSVVMQELGQTSRALTQLFQLVRRFTRAYDREKRRLRVLDFADLEHGAVRLLLTPSGEPRPLAKELSAQFREIMLDEYQDTNEVQDRIFAAISRDEKNLFFVGDVKQAIYRFRLADPGIFLEKYERFAQAGEAGPGEPRKIFLSKNFRSDRGILDAANAVFTACMSKDVGELDYGENERLIPGLERPALPGPVTELWCLDTKPQGTQEAAPDKTGVEAQFVAGRIRRMLDDKELILDGGELRPVRPEDIVILLRSPSGDAPAYIQALRSFGIACQSERERSVFEAPEIESLLSLLQVVDNPRQDIPLAAALLSPIFSMTADELAAIRANARDSDLYSALETSDTDKAKEIWKTLRALRELASAMELSEFLAKLYDVLQLEEVYGLFPDGDQRLRNLSDLFALAAGYSEGGAKSLSQFLANLDTMRAEQRGAQASSGSVRLMSIHKSKGLEFHVVFLAGLSKKFNERDYQNQVLLHPELGAGCNVYDEKGRYRYHSIAKRAIISRLRAESRAEELRVLYVAMTRAQDRLIMSYCAGGVDRKLKSIAQRLTLPPDPELAGDAGCLGDWILEAALLRTEAGELFAAGAKPMEASVSEIPWKIRYQVCRELPASIQTETTIEESADPSAEEALLSALRFRYPYENAVGIPAKITATQLKGRRLDEEVSDGRPQTAPKPLRSPVFRSEKALTAAEKGTATHLAMQYLDFSKTGSVEEIAEELRRLVREEYLRPVQAEAVSAEKLYRIFAGPIGEKIRSAEKVIREFKFSILTDASIYDPKGAGEQMLLQGVTDCCLIRSGALTVIDFKTDRVGKEQAQTLAERYRGQLEAYSHALSRIFGLPVKEKLLYFFHCDTAVTLA